MTTRRRMVIPVASTMEHRDEYPHALVSQMKEMGLFGLNIPEAYGGSWVGTTFGQHIAEYQTIQNKLADIATRIEASRLLIYSACEKRDRGERCDLEAGMAKLFATETAAEVAFEAMRIPGANGYSKDFPVERYYREAPLLVIGGGTNELQRLIIARNLLKKYKEED